MIFKVDSLGEIMKKIKVYLLNGLTCRRMEGKQKAWLKVTSHDGSYCFCGAATSSEGAELATHFSLFNIVDMGPSHTVPIIQMKKLGQRAVT